MCYVRYTASELHHLPVNTVLTDGPDDSTSKQQTSTDDHTDETTATATATTTTTATDEDAAGCKADEDVKSDTAAVPVCVLLHFMITSIHNFDVWRFPSVM